MDHENAGALLCRRGEPVPLLVLAEMLRELLPESARRAMQEHDEAGGNVVPLRLKR